MIRRGKQSIELTGAAQKLSMREVRRLIREEFMRGVPDHALRTVTKRYVDDVRRLIFSSIIASKSDSSSQRSAMASANVTLEELEQRCNDLLKDQLWTFLRQA